MLSSADELEITLEARARMLGTLSFVSVRQQQHESGILAPLGAARRDELIDDRLRDVGEVAVLRFPQHELVGRGDAESVLEAEHRRLGQRAVIDLERARRLRQLASGVYTSPVFDVVQHRLAMRERAALGVLAGEAHADAVGEQRREGERLGVAPIDAAAVDRVAPARQRALNRRVELERRRPLEQLLVERDELLGAHGRLRDRGRRAAPPRRPIRSCRRASPASSPDRSAEACRASASSSAFDVVLGHDTLAHEPRAADLARRRMVRDDLVHHRLRERRLVGLVVAVAAVADEVDEEILIEPLAVGDAKTHGLDARLGVVGVDVHDRDLEALRQIAGVVRRARVDRVGGEADLVVAR